MTKKTEGTLTFRCDQKFKESLDHICKALNLNDRMYAIKLAIAILQLAIEKKCRKIAFMNGNGQCVDTLILPGIVPETKPERKH